MKKKLLTVLAILTGITGIAFSIPQMTKSNADDSGQKYIEDIVLEGAYWSIDTGSNVIDFLNEKYERDYTLVDQDLNDGCGTTTDYIYSYYATTTDYSEAICDIIITNDGTYKNFVDDRGIRYWGIEGWRADAGITSTMTRYCPYDCNKGAGGDDIFLFFTKDSRAGDPITSFGYTDNKNDSNKTYVKNLDGEIIDLNKGAGGDDIFMYVKRESKGTDWYPVNIYDYDLNGTYQCTKRYTTQQNKTITSEILQPVYEKPNAEFVGYFYEDGVTEVKVGDTVRGEVNIYASWKYDITIDLSSVEGENIEYTDLITFPELEAVSMEGKQFDGWYYQGTSYQAVSGKTLRKGGVIEPRFTSTTSSIFNSFVTEFEEYNELSNWELENKYNNKNYLTEAQLIALRAALLLRRYTFTRDESLVYGEGRIFPVECMLEGETFEAYSSRIEYFILFAYGAKDDQLLIFLRNYQEETCVDEVDKTLNLAYRFIIYQELCKRGYCFTLNGDLVESNRKDITTLPISQISDYLNSETGYDELINITNYVDELNTCLGNSNFYSVDPTIRNYTDSQYETAKANNELDTYLQAKYYLFGQLLAGYHINDDYELVKNTPYLVANIRYDVKSDLTTWCNTYLHMEDYTTSQGYCSDSEHHYYKTAKENLSLLSEEQINMFIADSDFTEAYNRLCTWATFNGDYFEINDGNTIIVKSKVNQLDGLISSDTESITILIVSVSMIALAAFVLTKKKKHSK